MKTFDDLEYGEQREILTEFLLAEYEEQLHSTGIGDLLEEAESLGFELK
jgi:hypothetical protein